MKYCVIYCDIVMKVIAKNNETLSCKIHVIMLFSYFKGWRAVWVAYKEALLVKKKDIHTMKITAPMTEETRHPLFFDILRFASQVKGQSRDKVVPTLDEDLYSPNNFWQQTYRWSQVRLKKNVGVLWEKRKGKWGEVQ